MLHDQIGEAVRGFRITLSASLAQLRVHSFVTVHGVISHVSPEKPVAQSHEMESFSISFGREFLHLRRHGYVCAPVTCAAVKAVK